MSLSLSRFRFCPLVLCLLVLWSPAIGEAAGYRAYQAGYSSDASGGYSSAVGSDNTASGWQSSAIGHGNKTSGYYTSAVGYNNTASGASYSPQYGITGGGAAFGKSNKATEILSSSFGQANTASGSYSSAFGYKNTANGEDSSAVGFHNAASGSKSTAVGYSNAASASASSAVGRSNTASGNNSSAFGYFNTASGSRSSAFGYINKASGNYSYAFGYNNTSASQGSTAMGYYGETESNPEATSYSKNDKWLLNVGNGEYDARSNALVLQRDGDLWIEGDLTSDHFGASSDERLKKDIAPLSSPLQMVESLRGVSFTWKKNNKPSIGFIAQEVEKVIPSLVLTGEDGYKTVAYGQFTALLVEAVKELKESQEVLWLANNELLAQNQELSAQNKTLEKRVTALETR